MKFKIISLGETPIVKEVNPFEEEYNYCINTDFTKGQHPAGASIACFKVKKEWQEAESKLKEYQLSEESMKDMIMEFNEQSLNDSKPWSFDEFFYNKVIEGEIVNQDGNEKVKII
jgi:hypothetical protein